MKFTLNRKTFLAAAILPAVLFSTGSCKKDNDNPSSGGSYPRSVTIQYKVSSPAGFTQASQLIYTNESGGSTVMTNVPLPFTKSITKTVNRFEVLVLMFSNTGTGSLKGEILIDNVVKASQTATGSSPTSDIPGSADYTFP